MDSLDLMLKNVIESAIRTSTKFDPSKSLSELYTERKQALKLSDRQIQKILGIDRNSLLPILEGTGKQVNFINIIKLAHFLELSVNDVLRLYVPRMDRKLIGELERSRQAGYIMEYFDVPSLIKMNFFKIDSSAQEMTDKLTRFFNLDVLFDYSDGAAFAVASRTNGLPADLMQSFWIRAAMTQLHHINNPNDYNRGELIKLLPKIKPFTRDTAMGLTKVIKALHNVGVTVIFQPNIANVAVRGATLSVRNKPCIVLSNADNSYPSLWINLLHELHHVMFNFEEIQNRGYHLTSAEGDLYLMDEEKADYFAKEYLINDTRLRVASRSIDSPTQIEKLARQWSIHPSFIYLFHCFETFEWSYYLQDIPTNHDALKLLHTKPFHRESLLDAVKLLQENVF